jgi:hypothetical protein
LDRRAKARLPLLVKLTDKDPDVDNKNHRGGDKAGW